jgi:hypothetical protein
MRTHSSGRGTARAWTGLLEDHCTSVGARGGADAGELKGTLVDAIRAQRSRSTMRGVVSDDGVARVPRAHRCL